jgi:gas vesicle protein
MSEVMNRNRTLVAGALIGAMTGLVAAMLLNRRAEESGNELALTTGDGMKLGVMVIGLLRAIASLGEEK